MQKFHIKRGDIVVVIAGATRARQGKVLEILAEKTTLAWKASP